MKTMIIAEAGVNHNGSLEQAKKLIDAFAATGADYIKFQTFKASALVRHDAILADYQKKQTNFKSQFEMLKSLELSFDNFRELFAYASSKKIKIFSTAFDLESLELLVSLGQKIFKISSGDVDNFPLLREIAKSQPELVILSTGASEMPDVAQALAIFERFGVLRDRLVVLHCTSQYPSPLQDVNLKAMTAIHKEFHIPVGYSDHTEGFVASLMAVAMGATVIEKHFTLDRNLPGPDHQASLDVKQFTEFVSILRQGESALGDGHKKVMPSEQANKQIIRKTIVAAKPIKKGEIFEESMLTVKRPVDGLSPMQWETVIGQTAKQDFKIDQPIVL